MRVRILSGNLAGQVVDLPQHEAEADIAAGFAELAPAETVTVTVEVPVAAAEPAPVADPVVEPVAPEPAPVEPAPAEPTP